jgi:hypothetical protein
MNNIEALDDIAQSFGVSALRPLSGSFSDENDQPAIAFQCTVPSHLGYVGLFRIEDKLSEVAGITVMLFPNGNEVTKDELLGAEK